MYNEMYFFKIVKYVLEKLKFTILKQKIEKGIQCDPNFVYNNRKR